VDRVHLAAFVLDMEGWTAGTPGFQQFPAFLYILKLDLSFFILAQINSSK